MKIGSLCTGYGGLDLAVEAVTGGHTVWYSEFDKHAAKIMEHHRPHLTNLWDLTKVDWATIEPIDILTAGYPCQPFSASGQRKGTNDTRHIWPSIAKAIGLLRPRIVILENVRGHVTLGFDEVLATLASFGYDARWQVVRASDVGAPHQRARLFVIAYPGHSIGERCQDKPCCKKSRFTFKTNTQLIANANDRESIGSVPRSRGGSMARNNLRLSEVESKTDWGKYKQAITHWEALTRKCPNPKDSENRLNPVFVEWMMGLPDGWVTGTSLSRTQQLKALGNGVVPQQAEHALNLLLQ